MAALVETMAYAGEVPWHGIGTEVPSDVSPDQMLKFAGLDWEVQKVPSYINVNQETVFTGRHALVRSSDKSILDIVTDDWNPVQNHDAFKFFNDFVYAGDMEMHTAGSLKSGQIVWALAKIKDSFELFGGDKVEGYLLFSNPHRFGQAIDIRFTPIRVVCNNTLTLSLNSHSQNFVKVNHRTVFDPEKVKETLGVAHDQLVKYKEMAEFLGSKRYTNDSVREYLDKLMPTLGKDRKEQKLLSVTADKALELLETQPGANFAEGSWWQPFNAVTYMTDHVLGRSADTRLTSSWYGANKNLKLKALNLAVEMAEAA